MKNVVSAIQGKKFLVILSCIAAIGWILAALTFQLSRVEDRKLSEARSVLTRQLNQLESYHRQRISSSFDSSPYPETSAYIQELGADLARMVSKDEVLKALAAVSTQARAEKFPLNEQQHTQMYPAVLVARAGIHAELSVFPLSAWGVGFWIFISLGLVAALAFVWGYIGAATNRVQALETTLESNRKRFEDHSAFAREIGAGNLNAQLSELDDSDSLGQALYQMQASLKEVSAEDEKRDWINTGLARFSELLRTKTLSPTELTGAVIAELVKTLDASLGAIFLTEEQESPSHAEGLTMTQHVDSTHVLRLAACYAYDRQKYIEQTLLPGEGLVGQVYLERESLLLTEVPQNYIQITSGLGESLPQCVFIVPLLINDRIFGVVELASFKVFEEHQVQFIRQLAESIASTLSMARNNQLTRDLLEKAESMNAELQEQGEQLQQNLAELQATQDQMEIKEAELAARNLAVANTMATAEFGMDLRLQEANRIFGDLLGQSPAVLQNMPLLELLHPDFLENWNYESFLVAVRQGEAQMGEYIFQSETQGKSILRAAFSVIRDKNQIPVRIFLVANDITQERVLVDQLHQEKELIEKVRAEEKARSDHEINSLNELMNDYMNQNQQEKNRLKSRIKELEEHVSPTQPNSAI